MNGTLSQKNYVPAGQVGLLQFQLLVKRASVTGFLARDHWSRPPRVRGRRRSVEVAATLGTPIGFRNDPDRSRYHRAYPTGIRLCGARADWFSISRKGGFQVLGRSDATLDRGGVRFGSADVYNAASSVEGLHESLVVGVELPDSDCCMPLLLAVYDGGDGEVVDGAVAEAIANMLTLRHMPDAVMVVPDVPQTRTDKRIESRSSASCQGSQRAKRSTWLCGQRRASLWFEDCGRTDVGPRIATGIGHGRAPVAGVETFYPPGPARRRSSEMRVHHG